MTEKGHQIKLLIKSKDVLENLVAQDGFNFNNILEEGRNNSTFSILFALLKRNVRLNRICRDFKPDIMIGTDPSLAQIGFLRNIPVITCLEDDIQVIPQLALLTYPFTNYIFAPEVCSVGKYKRKKIAYKGLMKLAYLHPNLFIPDKDIKNKYIGSDDFSLIRLSALGAHHDINESGISDEFLNKIIAKLQQIGKVYISSEKALPIAYEKYRLEINPSHIHHILAFAKILVSDSQSMSVEASILGTPSIRISSFVGRISVLEELEHKYKLTFGFKPDNQSGILKRLDEILLEDDEFLRKTKTTKLLEDKIDVSSFLTWIIDDFPLSIKSFHKNPEIQYNFK